MKIRSTFHVSVFLMAVLTFSMPFVTFAQQAAAQGANHLVITSQLALIRFYFFHRGVLEARYLQYFMAKSGSTINHYVIEKLVE